MLEVEVIGSALDAGEVRRACEVAAGAAGVREGHVAVEFVGPERITTLNREFRGREGPTDVLSFPVDEEGAAHGERELGDVVICAEHSDDLLEVVVHGVLHLTGMDHETDKGEMLALQGALLARLR